VKANAAFARSARGVVLNAPSLVHVDLARVHAHGHGHFQDALGSDDALDHSFVQAEQVPGFFNEGDYVEPRVVLVSVRLFWTCDHVVTSL
jgi:hypothetical protein